DGRPDLAIVNGRVARRPGAAPTAGAVWDDYAERNQLFANEGGGRFRDVSPASPAFCGTPRVSRGLAVGDFDNDGAPDLLVTAVAAALDRATDEVRRAPRSAAAWGRLGQLLLAYRFPAEADACLARAEQLDPAEPRWPYHRGALRAPTDPEEAVGHWQRAVERGGEQRDAIRLRLATALRDLGRADKSRGQYEALLSGPLAA